MLENDCASDFSLRGIGSLPVAAAGEKRARDAFTRKSHRSVMADEKRPRLPKRALPALTRPGRAGKRPSPPAPRAVERTSQVRREDIKYLHTVVPRLANRLLGCDDVAGLARA